MTKNSIRPPFEHTAPLPYTLCNQKHLQTNRNILKKTQTNINIQKQKNKQTYKYKQTSTQNKSQRKKNETNSQCQNQTDDYNVHNCF